MRRIGLVVAVAGIAIGAAMACAPLAGAAGRAQLRLVAPHDGASVRVNGRTLVVRLRVSGAGFMAVLGGHDVTGRFGRARGGVRTARFVRGRDFKLGRDAFLAAVGKPHTRAHRAVSFTFTARRPVHRMLAMRGVSGAGSAGRGSRSMLGDLFGPLGPFGELVPNASAFVTLHSPKHPSALRLKVNGHRATGDLTMLGDGRHAAGPLGASTGLRYGSNRLVAYMEGPKWTYARKTIRVRVPRRAPLAGAGPNRRTGAGDTALLDGSKSRAAHRGKRLLYRWRVASAPKGAKLRLRRAHSQKALLKAGTPGRYRLRLTVAAVGRRHHRGHGHARRRAPAFTGSANRAFAAAARSGDVAADSTTVTVSPTSDPMGAAIETMAQGAGGSGSSTFVEGVDVPEPSGSWAQMVALDQGSLHVVDHADIDADDPGALVDDVKNTAGTDEIVVISGLGHSQGGDTSAMVSDLSQAVKLLGGTMPSDEVAQRAVASGNWSVLGTVGVPSRIVQNIDGVTEAPVPGAPSSTAPGSLNGYLQDVTSAGGNSFVSPEYVPIDTRAPGSTDTKSVFKIGSQTYPGESIPSGSLGIHLVAVNRDASMKPLWNQTFTIVNGNDQTNQGSFDSQKGVGTGVMGLAYTLRTLTQSPLNLLIVMQTVGTSTVGPWTAPGASPNWVNDALMHPTANGLWEWNGQPYSSSSITDLDSLWNPGSPYNYPTVAGQVGLLTGTVGHDLIANFGANVGVDGGYEVTRLSMVANNHPYDPSMNYIKGTPAPAHDQLVGTLTRTSQSQWRINGGVPTDRFGGPELWELAFKPSTPWPLSTGAANKAAMEYIAHKLWPAQPQITDVRPQYVAKASLGASGWQGEANEVAGLPVTSGPGFSKAKFTALRKQLTKEMNYLSRIDQQISTWKAIFTESESSGGVELTKLGASIASTVVSDNAQRLAQLNEEHASIDPLEIASDALLTGASLVGFGELSQLGEAAEQIGAVAHVLDFAAATLGLADSSSSGEGGSGETIPGPNTFAIQDKVGQLGSDLYNRFELAAASLDHLGDIFASDWGKLKTAGINSTGVWAFGDRAQANLQQSLSVNTSRGFYEALLPYAYRQWVISPYYTFLKRGGPPRPGWHYLCRYANSAAYTTYPFRYEPSGALSWVNYRPWEPPGDTTGPAQPYTVNYTVRALKSIYDPLELGVINYNPNPDKMIGIVNDGANPDSGLIDPLFKPVNPGDPKPWAPTDLGMSKTEFYAGYSGGGSFWQRMICARGR